jgi:hypothetical protein
MPLGIGQLIALAPSRGGWGEAWVSFSFQSRPHRAGNGRLTGLWDFLPGDYHLISGAQGKPSG